MEESARAQIRLIVDHVCKLAQDAFSDRLKSIYHRNAAAGLLQSGATVRMALRDMDEIASQLIKDAVVQVSEVATEPEAFALLHASLDDYLNWLDQQSVGVASMASGKPRGIVTHDSVHQAARREFATVRTKLTRQIEIHRFAFSTPVLLPDPKPWLGQDRTLFQKVGGPRPASGMTFGLGPHRHYTWETSSPITRPRSKPRWPSGLRKMATAPPPARLECERVGFGT